MEAVYSLTGTAVIPYALEEAPVCLGLVTYEA